jgi:hypothetical protein
MICFSQLLYLWLTPWSKVLVDKLVRHQRVNKFLAYKTRSVITAFTKSATCPIRNQMNLVYTLFCFCNIEFSNTVFVVVDLNTAVATYMSILNDSWPCTDDFLWEITNCMCTCWLMFIICMGMFTFCILAECHCVSGGLFFVMEHLPITFRTASILS